MNDIESRETRNELFGMVRQWIVPKLELGEGFSVLLVSVHPDGNRMTKYSEDSVELALAKCRQEFNARLKDAAAYALVYDARMQIEEELRFALIYQGEVRGNGPPVYLAELYRLDPDEHDPERQHFRSDGEFHRLPDEAAWLD